MNTAKLAHLHKYSDLLGTLDHLEPIDRIDRVSGLSTSVNLKRLTAVPVEGATEGSKASTSKER